MPNLHPIHAILTPMPHRSRHPKAQHHCPHCGYDVAGLLQHERITCPECGTTSSRQLAKNAGVLSTGVLNKKQAATIAIAPTATLAVAVSLAVAFVNDPAWIAAVYFFVGALVLVATSVAMLLHQSIELKAIRAHLPFSFLFLCLLVSCLMYGGTVWLVARPAISSWMSFQP